MRRIRRIVVLCLVAVTSAGFALANPHIGSAAVGDCAPPAAWGTVDTAFASEVVALVNQHRQAMGLVPLGVSPTLSAAATWKSRHMAYYGYMQHDDPAPPVSRTVSDRLAACGYPIGSVGWGENIAYGFQTPQAVMSAWLNSPGHRANIENSSYRAIGVGAARSAGGLYYWTQDFGTFLDAGSPPPPVSTPPSVALTSAPAAATTSTSALFAWTTAGSPTSVTCALDGGPATACGSSRSYSGLAVGAHRFVVSVASSAGSSSASYNWTVSPASAGPTVALTSAPPASTTSTNASFAWSTTGAPTSVTCSVDGSPASPCTAPAAYSGLAGGTHRFVVTVASGVGSNSASYTWTISSATALGAPTVKFSLVPPATTASTSATFAWRTSGSPTSVTCSLDGVLAVDCVSRRSYGGLTPGVHRFVVTVANPSGASSASDTWTISG